MRILKFRAWDKQDKRWVCNVYEDEPFEIYLNGDYLGLAGSANDWQGSERYELSQFTGLHDRNGKEIYIGDIMVLDLISGDRVSKVHICPLLEIPTVCFFDDCGWEPLYCYVGKPDTCLQIVGNIYENPDLLK
jgi:hypothetical protein